MHDVGVVLEVARALGGAAAPEGPVEASVVRERAEQELAERAGRVQVVVAIESAGRFRERGEGETVPRGDRLVVPERLRALLADLEQPRALLLGQLPSDH